MHELSIALNIIDVAAEEARQQGPGRVAAIYLRLGPLSGVVASALRSAFEIARTGSPLPDADLVVEEVPLVAHCTNCAAERTLDSPQELCCPVCGAPTPDIVRGRELEVFALEIVS